MKFSTSTLKAYWMSCTEQDLHNMRRNDLEMALEDLGVVVEVMDSSGQPGRTQAIRDMQELRRMFREQVRVLQVLGRIG